MTATDTLPFPLGLTLEPGERVIFFDAPDYKKQKKILFIFGVVTLVLVIGIAFFVMAAFWERWQPRGVVVTDRRVVSVDKHGVATSTPLAEVADLDAEREGGAGGEGLLGAVAVAAVDAVADHIASKNPKQDPAFWKRTEAVVLLKRDGSRARVPTLLATELGPFLIRLRDDRSLAAQLPAILPKANQPNSSKA